MDQVIIYKDGERVVLISPFVGFVEQYGINAVALKDVPTGQPYKIIDRADLPDVEQERWSVDTDDLTDGVGADYGVGSQWNVLSYRRDGRPEKVVRIGDNGNREVADYDGGS